MMNERGSVERTSEEDSQNRLEEDSQCPNGVRVLADNIVCTSTQDGFATAWKEIHNKRYVCRYDNGCVGREDPGLISK